MKKWNWRRSGEQMVAVLKRDSLSVLSSVVAFAASTVAVWKKENGYQISDETLLSFAFAGAAGISLFLAVRLWSRQKRDFWGLSAAALLALAGFAYFHPVDDGVLLFRWFQFFLITHLLVALTPLRGPEGAIDIGNDTDLWRFNWYMLTRFLFGIAFCVPMVLGLMGALFALEHLFEIKVKTQVYGTTYFFVFFVASVFQVLSTISDTRVGKQSETVTRDLRRLVQFLFTPLALVYFALVYAYVVKIAMERAWPQGVIGWLVSSLSIGVFLMAILQRPLAESDLPPWIRSFWTRAFALLILPLIVLMLAVWRRVDDYGWTYPRVALMTLCLWALALSLLNARRVRPAAAWIPLTLTAVALLTLVGPLSPHFLSVLSQKAQVRKILGEGKPDFKAEKRVSSILTYVCREHGHQAMLKLAGDPEASIWKRGEARPECTEDDPAIQRAVKLLGIQFRLEWGPDPKDVTNEWFDIREEETFEHESGSLRWGTLSLTLAENKLIQSVAARGLTFEYVCCEPNLVLIQGRARIPIDLSPLLKKEQAQLEVKTPKGLLTLWLSRGQASLDRTGNNKLYVTGEMILHFVFSPENQKVQRRALKTEIRETP